MKKFPVSKWILAIGTFVIGMTEFVIMGLFLNIASDFHIIVGKAGQLISGYALGVIIGGLVVAHLFLNYFPLL
ncbi:hypothetical protein K4O86_11585 [Staphylococcus epidermidis]|nr:hypothetical protein [Staphylococcus epidermidis]